MKQVIREKKVLQATSFPFIVTLAYAFKVYSTFIMCIIVQIPLGSSRHDVSIVSSRACFNMADDEEALVLWFTSLVSVLWCFASISGTSSGKSEVNMSTQVHAVATPLNTCRASRACRARRGERVVPCCPTSTTRFVTSRHNFFLRQNAWAIYN